MSNEAIKIDTFLARLYGLRFVAEREVKTWSNFELAAFVDVRLDVAIEPEVLQDATVRSIHSLRALDEGERTDQPFFLDRKSHWIIADAKRIGTISFSENRFGFHDALAIEVSSFYIVPRYRRQGRARELLETVCAAAFAEGYGRVSLRCEWINQSALRFYMQLGFRVRNWKHFIYLYRDANEADWALRTQQDHAQFLIDDRVIAVAENHGDRLAWQPLDEPLATELEATAAVQLALMGWPIIRTDDLWQHQIEFGISEGGDFENLAHALRRFERYACRKGWIVPVPNPSFARIPTLQTVTEAADRFVVQLSDGRNLPIPFDTLDALPTGDDPIEEVKVTADELSYRLRSGAEEHENIDHILWLNQSPEHLEKTRKFYLEMRA